MDMPIEKVKRFIDEMDEEKVKYIQLRGLNLSQYGLGLYKEHKKMEKREEMKKRLEAKTESKNEEE